MISRGTFWGMKSIFVGGGVLMMLLQGGCLALNNPDATKPKKTAATTTTTTTIDDFARSGPAQLLTPGITDGQLISAVSKGTKLYAAGMFTYYGAPNMNGALIVDPAVGVTPSAIAASPQFFNIGAEKIRNSMGIVTTAVADPNEAGAFFVGGQFTHVDGIPHTNLARIKPDGTLDTAWVGQVPEFGAAVLSLATNGTSLFVAGTFTSVSDGATHASSLVAKFNAANGLVQTAFTSPLTFGEAYAVAIFPGGKVALGGDFSCGVACDHYVVLDGTTGADTGDGGIGADDTVRALVGTASMMFVGGNFTALMGNAAGHLGAIDATDPAVFFGPLNTDGAVTTMALDATHCYVGGNFTDIAGTTVQGVARILLANGTVDTNWLPTLGANPMFGTVMISAIYPSATRVHFQGAFLSVNGETRINAAIVDKVTGTTNDPLEMNLGLWFMGDWSNYGVIAESGGRLLHGGAYVSVGGTPQPGGIMEIDLETGQPTAWDPGLNVPYVNQVAIAGDLLYILGYFSSVSGQARPGIAAYDLFSGTPVLTAWNPSPDNQIRGFGVNSSAVYIYGDFTDIGGVPREDYAAFDHGSSVPNAWAPTIDGSIDNEVFPQIAVYEDSVYLQGAFTQVNGVARVEQAEVDAVTGALKPWNPTPIPGSTPGPTVITRVGDKVLMAGRFNWGLSNQYLIATDAATGADLGWAPAPDASEIYGIKVIGDHVYVTGMFTTIAGQPRPGLARFNVADLSLSDWTPSISQGGGFTLNTINDNLDEGLFLVGLARTDTIIEGAPSVAFGVLRFDAYTGDWITPE